VPRHRPRAPAAQKKSLIAAERDPLLRAAWQQTLAGIDPRRLVFLDETATPTTLTRRQARAPVGVRAVGAVPHRRWQAVTLIACLSMAGMGEARSLEGALTRESFHAYVEQALVPSLIPGQIVILDNLAVHKSARAIAAIEAVGCTVCFLPPYSPDFNPIELAFSKLKQHLRTTQARTFATVVAATGPALDAITRHDAAAFFAHCGYRQAGQLL
jgi:transposase